VNNQVVQELQQAWSLLFPKTEPPATEQWALWALMYDQETIRLGLLQLTKKYRNVSGDMTPDHMGKFLSAVMARISQSDPRTVAPVAP
jgi:hypothetical protein